MLVKCSRSPSTTATRKSNSEKKNLKNKRGKLLLFRSTKRLPSTNQDRKLSTTRKEEKKKRKKGKMGIRDDLNRMADQLVYAYDGEVAGFVGQECEVQVSSDGKDVVKITVTFYYMPEMEDRAEPEQPQLEAGMCTILDYYSLDHSILEVIVQADTDKKYH